MDSLSPEDRSQLMARIRGGNTAPEMVVRRILTRLGYRYRLHVRGLPGSPDLVLRSRSAVIFVDGCYWHRHSCKRGRSIPSSRTDFWKAKFRANTLRDRRVRRRLRAMGWRVITVWECQTKPSRAPALERRLERLLFSGRCAANPPPRRK
ncbi:MAG: very short patch repair endonuclease [Planctomycetota bacterium]|nr:very short patch repair endonuclease [Planctomycetota bacterium]